MNAQLELHRNGDFVARSNAVHCDMPLGCVGKEDEAIDVWGNEHDLEICWPVSMEFASPLPLLMARPLLGAAPPGGVQPQLFPPRVGGGSFSWENDFCAIDSLGTAGVRKLGHTVGREITGVLHFHFLDE